MNTTTTQSAQEQAIAARARNGKRYAHLPTRQTMIDRLARTLDGATPEQWSAGIGWYPAFAGIADLLAERHGVTFEEAAATLAILSPRTSVTGSVVNADTLLAAFKAGGEDAARQVRVTLPDNVNKAVDWLTGKSTRATDLDADGLDRARKVRSFYRNITGDEDAVTVDIWATRAAGGTMEQPNGGAYIAIADAYRTVAARYGLSPREAQAAVWTATRSDIDAEAELWAVAQWLRTAPIPA